jgi:zinc/manganese transport system ATP-binding protein
MLECKNLTIGAKDPITDPFNILIEENQWFGIIGENGSGKSTFLKTILGILKPQGGSITVFKHMPGWNNDSISYIPQEREINVSELMSGLNFIKCSYKGWKFGFPLVNKKINNWIKKIFNLVGATAYMHQPFYTLSGGQKKRIYLAQALISKPKLLLLDEPLADLDPKAREHFIETLREIRTQQKLSVLITSHDMHEIAPYLDGFIHFKNKAVHQCVEIPCAREDSYVGI